jgi:hypothetical protein
LYLKVETHQNSAKNCFFFTTIHVLTIWNQKYILYFEEFSFNKYYYQISFILFLLVINDIF